MDLVSETPVPICVPRFTIQPCCHTKTLVVSSLAPGPWKKMLPLSRTTTDWLLLPLRSHHWRSHHPGTLSQLQRSCDLTLTKMTFYCQFPLSHLTLNSSLRTSLITWSSLFVFPQHSIWHRGFVPCTETLHCVHCLSSVPGMVPALSRRCMYTSI